MSVFIRDFEMPKPEDKPIIDAVFGYRKGKPVLIIFRDDKEYEYPITSANELANKDLFQCFNAGYAVGYDDGYEKGYDKALSAVENAFAQFDRRRNKNE